ncbi:hypothetical protein JCM5350_006375 [Sporobolomyces pararoseus]
MSHLVQFDYVDPFKQARSFDTTAGNGYGQMKGNGKTGTSFSSGLSVRYEGSSPYEQRQDVRIDDMGWDRNDVPIPRTKAKRNTRGPRDTRMSMRPEPSRVDSVLDVYAELYADEGVEEDRHQSYYSPNRSTKHDDLIPFQSIPQPVESWDERGKNGLYGGGGRGADDRETGWVRGYSIGSSVPSVGFEEDLRFDDHGVTNDDDDEQDTPRSSSETGQSGSYPVTPTSSHFPTNRPSSARLYDSPKSTSSPPRSSRVESSPHSRNPSASQTTFRTPERPPRTDSPARDAPLSPSDLNLLRKKAPQPTGFPTPSSPLAASPKPAATPAAASPARPTTPKRSNSIFKKYGRSKKPPTISNPILPEGFVESLGMKTFTLTPGCKAPVFGEEHLSAPSTPQTPDRPSLPLNQPPRVRDSPPSSRPTPAPRSVSSVRDHNRNYSSGSHPPFQPPPVHSFDPSVHRQSDVYPQEAMARLSMASDTSTHSVPQAPQSTMHPPNHRQFFDQLRQERSRPEDRVEVDRAIPSMPLRPSREPYGARDGGVLERAWGSAAAVSKEDERGHSIHYDSRGNEEGEDSATSSYSEHSDFGSRRPSMVAGGGGGAHDVSSYYSQSQPTSRDTRYDLHEGGGYDRSSQVEMLDQDYSHYGAGPIQPLNVKRTPPLSNTAPTLGGGTPRALAHFNRGGGAFASGRNSTIDPLSSFAGVKKKKVSEGPAIGSTGFRNPFG